MLTDPQRLTLIDDLVRPVWEKICPRGDALAWQYALTDPVPESWPARGGVLVFYAYARALNLAQPTSGEFSGPVWARIRHVLDSGESRLELLQQVINPGPRRGFRPLTGREYEILQAQPLTLLGAPLSKEGEHQLRDYFRLQLSLGNVPPEVVAAHAAFFNGWVANTERVMSSQLEGMNGRIGWFEEKLAEGDGIVDFAEQLRVGQGLAGMVEDEQDFAVIRQLFDQASPHMRRLGSLALEAIAHRWYADAAPLALRHLDDGFDWVEYDCMRFFLNQAPLDAATLQRLDDKLARTRNASITRIAEPGLLALRALAASYEVPMRAVEAKGFRFQLPETWQITREVADAVTFSAPAIDWLEQSKNPCRNQFLLQVVRDVDPAELEELAEVNLEGFGVETTIDHPDLARYAGSRAMRYGTQETYPTVRIREVRTYGTTLLCMDTRSPLAHLEQTLARNLAILDSIQPL